MKKIILAALFLTGFAACTSPIRVTANPDSREMTSGTLGSAKVENSLPQTVVDTTKMNDTLKIKRDHPQN